MKLHIGFDDTDSLNGGCTTYIAALLIERMRRYNALFIDYPSLIRLNPNVPWKTRGNGAVCFRMIIKCEELNNIKETVVGIVEEQADLDAENTNPGIVFFQGEIPFQIEVFAEKAVRSVVRINTALGLIKKFKAEAFGFNERRGIIGGLAAIGNRLKRDHSYELITYRNAENRKTPRIIDKSSVVRMDKKLKPWVFNNIDNETERVLITPRGPDPILFGIRGENPEVVSEGYRLLIYKEPVERWVIFRTNQGTDAHFDRIVPISKIRPYNSVLVEGVVLKNPVVIPGGHTIFKVKDNTGTVDCAAYEPTGMLRNVAKMLREGDLLLLYGGARPATLKHPMTINLEKIGILRLAPILVQNNPLCPFCGKRTKSIGKNKGFECKRCGYHGPELKKTFEEHLRNVDLGVHVSSPRSQRHLTKPLTRYGLEKSGEEDYMDKVLPYEKFYGS